MLTIGFDFLSLSIKIKEQKVKLDIWDTCDQEKFRFLINSFYRNSSFVILVYSIVDRKSFSDLETWLNEIKTHSNPDIKIILIGNKVDLEDKREVSKERGEKLCSEHNLCFFMETSAKAGFNAQNLFKAVGKILYEEHLKTNDIITRPGTKLTIAYISELTETEVEEENNNRKKKCFC